MFGYLKFLMFPIGFIRRFASVLVVLALLLSLALNMTILTVTGVYTAATAALNAVGVTTVAAREAGEKLARRNAAKRIARGTAKNVTRRVQRGAARNIASVGAEAIPVLGVAVIAGALALEVKDACDTARDMAGLDAALSSDGDPEIARQAAVQAFDCKAMIREEIPDYDEYPTKDEIWQAMKTAPGEAYDAAIRAGIQIRNIDWSRHVDAFVKRVVDWTDKLTVLVMGGEEALQ